MLLIYQCAYHSTPTGILSWYTNIHFLSKWNTSRSSCHHLIWRCCPTPSPELIGCSQCGRKYRPPPHNARPTPKANTRTHPCPISMGTKKKNNKNTPFASKKTTLGKKTTERENGHFSFKDWTAFTAKTNLYVGRYWWVLSSLFTVSDTNADCDFSFPFGQQCSTATSGQCFFLGGGGWADVKMNAFCHPPPLLPTFPYTGPNQENNGKERSEKNWTNR